MTDHAPAPQRIEQILCTFPGVAQASARPAGDDAILAEVAFTPAALERQSSMQESVWKMVFEQTFEAEGDKDEPTFHPGVWGSTYTGQAIETEAIRSWIDGTVKRVLELSPKRVLELGCGDGQIMLRVLPHCEEYLGVDFSEAAVAHVQTQLDARAKAGEAARGGAGRVERRSATELDDLPPGSFDTIVLNSVAQYFPSAEYLLDVVKRASRLIAPGGAFFLGDLRDLALADAFYTSVELARAERGASVDALRQAIGKRAAEERELLVHPSIARHLLEAIPEARSIVVRAKPGPDHDNELVRFRFDLTIHMRGPSDPHVTPPAKLAWGTDPAASLDAVRVALDGAASSNASLLVTGLPHGRLEGLFRALGELASLDGGAEAPVQRLRALEGERPQVDTAALEALADATGYVVAIGPGAGPDLWDALFTRAGASQGHALPIHGAGIGRALHRCTTHPTLAKVAGRLANKLLGHLRAADPSLADRTRIAVVPAIDELAR